ncbi:hypothetical protein BAE44_0018701, partial [Dichanthelium oligosanthes]
LLLCVFSKEVWFSCLSCSGWQLLLPSPSDNLTGWWLRSRKLVAKPRRKAFDSFSLLITRLLWLERNSRVFKGSSTLPGSLVSVIFDHVDLWSWSGLLDRSRLFGE